ncbi:tricarballylate dehydrogenase [Campylobacter jejuni]|uniref:FAD-dependent tricarballylate dehydrogenase TcuA n=1 Tax=Campylobacter jejuni TaxID=197 RepID=UPI000258A21F|nr:FAD-dependent tricarballylate dehydrogenase TcuA [Campylobacter jejuni]AXL46616.1 tricarballylate dehydrogenase [Campylobacter jejuni]EIB76831.1 tricarballylate dehydrogenase [Campylobacter jejuni subsp. jejuni 1213]MBW1404666.1 tricarballylate dehydrogenase [Campylobacter jejuni]MBW1437161.1 tricarballylate dehydrogenase [Campylobacter jejuni]OEV51681.1 tricarballylate dehydrogenase [Campylobacter jejuni]
MKDNKKENEMEFDIVAIGGGNAALCAAIAAASKKENIKIALLESSPKEWRGGNSQHTRNLRSMHDKPTDVLTQSYSEDEFFEDVFKVTKGQTNEEYARFVISRTPKAVEFAKKYGVRFQPSMRGTLHLGRTNAFFLGGGKSLVNAYFNAAKNLGVEIFYEFEALDLMVENGCCKEILVLDKKQNQEVKIKTKAVIVASGGFESNLEWLEEAWGQRAKNFIIRGTRFNQGKMLKALEKNHAQIIGDPTQGHMVAIDARTPKYDGGIASRVDCVSLGIVVNKKAQRFYDEGEDFWPKRYAIWGRLVANEEDQIAYSITDSKVQKCYMPSLFEPIVANSIEELASKMNLDPKALKMTLDEYNQSVVEGEFDHTIQDNCHTQGLKIEKTHWALKIDTPPFYCYPLRPGVTFTYMGVKVDKNARVYQENGELFKNIFAAGEIMAGNILTQGYVAGFGMSIGSVFGRLAGENALELVKDMK